MEPRSGERRRRRSRPAPRAGSRPGSAPGCCRWAPGTWGSLAALPLAWLLVWRRAARLLLAGRGLVFALGLWAADRYMEAVGVHDPGAIVIDEVAGQWLTLAVAPLDPLAYLLGFVLFRIARRAQALAGELARPAGRRRLRRDDRRRRRRGSMLGRARGSSSPCAAMTFPHASLDLARRLLAACEARGFASPPPNPAPAA